MVSWLDAALRSTRYMAALQTSGQRRGGIDHQSATPLNSIAQRCEQG
jgi:hypothetical protein